MAEDILGIDIGGRNITFALIRQGKKPKILNTSIIPTPIGSVVDGEFKDIFAISMAIKRNIVENKLKGKKLALCINSTKSGLREFNLQGVKHSEIYEAVEFDLSKTFKGIGETHNLSCKIHEKTKDSVSGIVAFCPKQIVEQYIQLGKELELPVKYLDINSNCIAKTYANFIKSEKSQDNVVIVEIGCNNSQVNMITGNKLVVSRNVPVGGSSIDKLISEKLGISIEQAEKDKLDKYPDYLRKGHDPDDFIKKAYEPIFHEIRQTLNFYSKSKVSNIFLMGGGSFEDNIERYFIEMFNIPTTVIKPIHNHSIYVNDFSRLISAIGAALREA